jgi:alanyl-tRNA synthetase
MNTTVVFFHTGSVYERGKVQKVLPCSNGFAVVVDVTPFHPVDHKWPDQPADRGFVRANERDIPLIDCVIAASKVGESEIFFDCDIPVGRADAGWSYFVAHLVAEDPELEMGLDVELYVDSVYRFALSAGHTGCHLAALALNAVLEQFWRKAVVTDGRGAPNFDQAAILVSKILEYRSYDRYRVGKTIKKLGFNSADFWEFAPELACCINRQLAEWINVASDIRMTPEEAVISSNRVWICSLFGQSVDMPCGGTHLSNLREIREVRVEIISDQESGTIEMHTMTTTHHSQIDMFM